MPPPDGLPLDRLAGADDGLEVRVVRVDREDLGGRTDPHRHDYHELVRIREGTGHHLLDGREIAVRPETVTVIGRGQVHLFAEGRAVSGSVVRFGDAVLPPASTAARPGPAWLLAGRGGRAVTLEPTEARGYDAAVDALEAELRRPPDPRTADLVAHLLATLLLRIERAWDAAHLDVDPPDGQAVALQRRFTELLERDVAAHHDAAHYAEALGVPQAALSQALVVATGRTTKELVLGRAMLEAQRLLRFTDLKVGEVAHRTGFADPLYFSRAFRRHVGVPPSAYRARDVRA